LSARWQDRLRGERELFPAPGSEYHWQLGRDIVVERRRRRKGGGKRKDVVLSDGGL